MAEGKPEHALYGRVAKFAKEGLGCFKTATSTGLKVGLIDVVGVRHLGGYLSGEFEVVAIEVKRGTERFATNAGQARSYSVYADRCYLAAWKVGREEFTADEVDIASALGVGLIRIGKRGVEEHLAAPKQTPIERIRQDLLFHIGCVQCALCGVVFDLGRKGATETAISRSSSRGGALRAARFDKGFVWWLAGLSEREGYVDSQGLYYARRYLCPDCVASLLRDLVRE